MSSLPRPEDIEANDEVKAAFGTLYFQGEDQAKAAIKNNVTFSNPVSWLLFVGPYWTPVQYGPFTKGQLSVRTLKPANSDSWKESHNATRRLAAPKVQHRLFLLGTADSKAELEKVIAATDGIAQPLRDEAALCCESYCQFSPAYMPTWPEICISFYSL
jgi:hypothetical protein